MLFQTSMGPCVNPTPLHHTCHPFIPKVKSFLPCIPYFCFLGHAMSAARHEDRKLRLTDGWCAWLTAGHISADQVTTGWFQPYGFGSLLSDQWAGIWMHSCPVISRIVVKFHGTFGFLAWRFFKMFMSVMLHQAWQEPRRPVDDSAGQEVNIQPGCSTVHTVAPTNIEKIRTVDVSFLIILAKDPKQCGGSRKVM